VPRVGGREEQRLAEGATILDIGDALWVRLCIIFLGAHLISGVFSRRNLKSVGRGGVGSVTLLREATGSNADVIYVAYKGPWDKVECKLKNITLNRIRLDILYYLRLIL
jgi:hypothetical protein